MMKMFHTPSEYFVCVTGMSGDLFVNTEHFSLTLSRALTKYLLAHHKAPVAV